MVFVDGDVLVRQVDAKQWELREPVVYQGAQETFTVPTGFRTDFASIPRLVVWLIPRYGLYTRSAILHDYLASRRRWTGPTPTGCSGARCASSGSRSLGAG